MGPFFFSSIFSPKPCFSMACVTRVGPSPYLRIDNLRGSWFSKIPPALLRRGRMKLDAAPFVENDDQNAPPAEKRDERLTAPLLRLLPGGRRGS
jgi:hypothetical protein